VKGVLYVKETKSGKDGVIALPPWFVNELEAWRKEQLRQAVGDPDRYGNGWIVPDKEGNPLSPQVLATAWEAVRIRSKVDISLHELRHTQATLQLQAGTPVNIVSQILRHSDSRITLNRYAHVLPHAQHQAAMVMEDIWQSFQTKSGESASECVQKVSMASENPSN